MKGILKYYTALIIILLSVSGAGSFELRIAGDKLSLHADKVPLQTILQRFTHHGIAIRIDPQINPEVIASFVDQDIQKGVDSILRSLDHVLIWESVKGSPGPLARLAEIQVFKPGKKGLMKQLGGRSNLVLAKNPVDGSLFVENEFLLRLSPGMSLIEFKRLLNHINGTVMDGNAALGIYKIRLPENSDVPELVEKVTKFPGVQRAEPNYAYPISNPHREPDPDLIVPDSYNIPATAGSVPIAILDSGLDMDYGPDGLVPASFDAMNPDESISDSLGHGTQMALIASGVIKPYGVPSEYASQNPVIPIRVFDNNGFTSNFDIMRSIDFALISGARLMSLSWGSETRSDFLENSLEYANLRGIIIVASAGNAPTGKPVYPAAYSSVIGVGALGPDGKLWKKSNYGDFVAVNAPGSASFPVGYKGDPGAYAGTSIPLHLWQIICHIIFSLILKQQNMNSLRQYTAI
ncbi:S8 family serine peptidase [Thermodesulfobacteriota bacterium]